METLNIDGRVTRVRFEPQRRDVIVVRAEYTSPNFRSVTFAGESLVDFQSAGFDDHVKLILKSDEGEVARDFTPRYFDPVKKELTIEFALHDHGFASKWAENVQPGQRAIVGGPRGSMIVPTDYDWHLFIGDATGLPAIARRLEELPSNTVAMALVLTLDPADRRKLKSRAIFNVEWINSRQELLDTVQAYQLPSGDGYIWCGAEASVAATVRRILVEQKGHSKDAIRSSAYWKRRDDLNGPTCR
jgi:NADPH-dependent ferric siderophore reductase